VDQGRRKEKNTGLGLLAKVFKLENKKTLKGED
jgi:hypothetical protein